MSLHRLIMDMGDAPAADFADLGPGEIPAAQNLENFLTEMTLGNKPGTISAQVGSVQATATITSTGAATAAQTMTLCNITLTAVAASPVENEFIPHATPGTQASRIAACINASTDLQGLVTAEASSGVVTVTAVVPGLMGNGLQIADVNLSNVTVAAFAGGDDGTSYTVDLE